MKRKRLSTLPNKRHHKPSACGLLQLPRELRIQIFQHLLYSPKPLGVEFEGNDRLAKARRNKRTFTFYPAILCVSQQLYAEGYEVLYGQNTVTATINLEPRSVDSFTECLGNLISFHASYDNYDSAVARRFNKWHVTIKQHIEIPVQGNEVVSKFVSRFLRTIPNLAKLKVQLHLWTQPERWKFPERRKSFTFDNPQNFDDFADQILRPFSAVRVRQAEFVDQQASPIRAASSLSRLMMSDTPSTDIRDLFYDLSSFLRHAVSYESRGVLMCRLIPLEIALDQYDVDNFRFHLRSILASLSSFRGLTLPQHLLEFAQDLASFETANGRIPGCTNCVFGQGAKSVGDDEL